MYILTAGLPVTITHPPFCDPRSCDTEPEFEPGVEMLVVHRAVLLDDGRRRVEARQADIVDATGHLLSSDAPTVGVTAPVTPS